MKIAIGNDHTACELKRAVIALLEEKGHCIVNMGPDEPDPDDDYPAVGEAVGRAVVGGDADLGVLICGTGVGISLAANKVKGVRAAVCSEPATARLTRLHNDANIIAFGARIVGRELALDIVRAFVDTEFSGEERHVRRIEQLREIEER